jgi:NAD(P)H-hydrate epimerase
MVNIPAITANQMREVDRLMIENFGIELIQMMENAGRSLAALSRQLFFNGDPSGKTVLVLVGRGGNGGGGLVAGRHLHNWGAHVHVYTTRSPSEFIDVPGHQFEILSKLGVPITFDVNLDDFPDSDLILDAVIGYSLRGSPRDQAANLIRVANKSQIPILSLDVPSGMDATSGDVYDPHIRASATLTLALPKCGLIKDHAKDIIGALYLADISVPPELYENIGLSVGPIFKESGIVQIN